jgi:tetratricopeptide (TPR) repeat protein
MMRPGARLAKMNQTLSRQSLRIAAGKPDVALPSITFGTLELNMYTQQGYAVDQAIDMALANGSPIAEGNPQDGYVVRGRNRTEPSEVYVVIEDGKARLLGTSNSYAYAGPEALARADAGLNDEALAVLTWAAKFVHPAANGDPVATSPLIHFWPVSQEGRAESIRFAAAALAATLGDPDAVPVLVKGRTAATSDKRRLDFDTALAADNVAQKDWKDLAPVAERLSNAHPESVVAFKYRASAYRGLKDWKKADAVVDDWLARHKNDPDGVAARAYNLTCEGKWYEARALLAPLVAAGTATTAMANQFAWLSVATHEVDESAVQAARDASQAVAGRAVQPFAVNHTLACVYAMSGRPKEALDVLSKAMDATGMATPNSAAWFAQGLIAEAYGDAESAAVYYGRVQPDALRDADPVSTYNLAQRRLARN